MENCGWGKLGSVDQFGLLVREDDHSKKGLANERLSSWLSDLRQWTYKRQWKQIGTRSFWSIYFISVGGNFSLLSAFTKANTHTTHINTRGGGGGRTCGFFFQLLPSSLVPTHLYIPRSEGAANSDGEHDGWRRLCGGAADSNNTVAPRETRLEETWCGRYCSECSGGFMLRRFPLRLLARSAAGECRAAGEWGEWGLLAELSCTPILYGAVTLTFRVLPFLFFVFFSLHIFVFSSQAYHTERMCIYSRSMRVFASSLFQNDLVLIHSDLPNMGIKASSVSNPFHCETASSSFHT